MSEEPVRGFSARDVALLGVVGAGAALFAEGFRAALHGLYRALHRATVIELIERLPFAGRVALVALGCLLGAALAAAASKRGRGGVPVIAEAISFSGRALSLRAAGWRALGALVAMASGAAIGREGPIIQFGAALGLRVGSLARLADVRRRELIAAGTAAGFAAAYNAPIAGVLFVIEVIAGLPARMTVARVGVATVAGATLAHGLSADRPLYGARTFVFDRSAELLGYAVVGLSAGALGVLFLRTLRRLHARVESSSAPRAARALLGGLAAGLVIAWQPTLAGNGHDGILAQLASAPPAWMLVALLVGKGLATVATVGAGVAGGVFTPSMFMGAALGLLVHRVGSLALPWAVGSPSALAFVGMAAMVAATTHAPLTAAVLIIELSRSSALTLPLLLATGLASLVARRFDAENIYALEAAAPIAPPESDPSPSDYRPDQPATHQP
jgi:CIC family chloride channel protein